jgi:hypothetical protein
MGTERDCKLGQGAFGTDWIDATFGLDEFIKIPAGDQTPVAFTQSTVINNSIYAQS